MNYREFLISQCGYRDVTDMGDGRWAAIFPLMFTHAIVVGKMGDMNGYDDRWCYHNYEAAHAALTEWQERGWEDEPLRWHRHPMTGRRRDENGVETINP